MVNIFLDTNVVVDIITKRAPYYDTSIKLIQYSNENDVQLYLSEGSVYTLIYLVYESLPIKNPEKALSLIISKCNILSSEKQLLLRAIKSSFKDKEDACQYYTALNHEVDYFITRNKKDFVPHVSLVPVYTPSEFLEIIS
ncbi:PIN domain-containing protein [Ekhidna sp.]|uniref:type II toxin-antitoxin system VapC family toxin n=1 Tax=Ekhidna sp. TaxID=2608089 RepID=UPI0032EE51A6